MKAQKNAPVMFLKVSVSLIINTQPATLILIAKTVKNVFLENAKKCKRISHHGWGA